MKYSAFTGKTPPYTRKACYPSKLNKCTIVGATGPDGDTGAEGSAGGNNVTLTETGAVIEFILYTEGIVDGNGLETSRTGASANTVNVNASIATIESTSLVPGTDYLVNTSEGGGYTVDPTTRYIEVTTSGWITILGTVQIGTTPELLASSGGTDGDYSKYTIKLWKDGAKGAQLLNTKTALVTYHAINVSTSVSLIDEATAGDRFYMTVSTTGSGTFSNVPIFFWKGLSMTVSNFSAF